MNVKSPGKRKLIAAKDGRFLYFETLKEAQAYAEELQKRMNAEIDTTCA